MIKRDFQHTPVTRGQQLGLPMRATPPDGSDGMDDELCRQTVAPCQLGISSLAATEKSALVNELGAGCSVDCAVYAAAAKQGGIRRVDNSVYGQGCDVLMERSQQHDTVSDVCYLGWSDPRNGFGLNNLLCPTMAGTPLERTLLRRQRLPIVTSKENWIRENTP